MILDHRFTSETHSRPPMNSEGAVWLLSSQNFTLKTRSTIVFLKNIWPTRCCLRTRNRHYLNFLTISNLNDKEGVLNSLIRKMIIHIPRKTALITKLGPLTFNSCRICFISELSVITDKSEPVTLENNRIFHFLMRHDIDVGLLFFLDVWNGYCELFIGRVRIASWGAMTLSWLRRRSRCVNCV